MSVSRETTRAAVCTVAVEARADLHVAAPAAGAAGAALTRRQARTVVCWVLFNGAPSGWGVEVLGDVFDGWLTLRCSRCGFSALLLPL